MGQRIEPANIAVIGNELAIAWNDGVETYIALDALRRACPCASCCGEPDALGNIERPDVHLTPASFELRGWQLVGGYAIMQTRSKEEAIRLGTDFMQLHVDVLGPAYEGELEIRQLFDAADIAGQDGAAHVR